MADEQQFTPVHGQGSGSQSDFSRRWEMIRPLVQERWPQLSHEELELIDGDVRKLVALVHQRTGAEMSDIEKEIGTMSDSSKQAGNAAKDPASKQGSESNKQDESQHASENDWSVGNMASSVQQTASSTARHVQSAASSGYRQVSQQISAAPVTSTGVSFGIGMLIGFCLAMVAKDYEAERQRRARSWYARYWGD